mgnify:CR=1 FL=1|jgi:hypothetical protein
MKYTLLIATIFLVLYNKFEIKKILILLIFLLITVDKTKIQNIQNIQKISLNFLPEDGDQKFMVGIPTKGINNIVNINNIIKDNHLWCPNMRNSKSVMSSCIEIKDVQGKNPKIFIVSTCCTRCLCKIIKNGMFFYQNYNGIYYLKKRENGNIFTVQILNQDFKSKNICDNNLIKNNKIYLQRFDYNKLDEQICKN